MTRRGRLLVEISRLDDEALSRAVEPASGAVGFAVAGACVGGVASDRGSTAARAA
jgi:hypothetical protein